MSMIRTARPPSALEAKVLAAWDNGDCYPESDGLSFDGIATLSGVPRQKIRRAVRALARKGYTQYHRAMWSDDGEPRGAGYGLTEKGWALIGRWRDDAAGRMSNGKDGQ